MARMILKIAGGLLILVGSFFGTMLVLDNYFPKPDMIRTANANSLMAALEQYRSKKGGYPTPPEVDVYASELSKYLDSVPVDPPGSDKMRYVSNGKAYGLRLVQSSGACIIEVGIKESGWWGYLPPC